MSDDPPGECERGPSRPSLLLLDFWHVAFI